jgi:hypothetical protein
VRGVCTVAGRGWRTGWAGKARAAMPATRTHVRLPWQVAFAWLRRFDCRRLESLNDRVVRDLNRPGRDSGPAAAPAAAPGGRIWSARPPAPPPPVLVWPRAERLGRQASAAHALASGCCAHATLSGPAAYAAGPRRWLPTPTAAELTMARGRVRVWAGSRCGAATVARMLLLAGRGRGLRPLDDMPLDWGRLQ